MKNAIVIGALGFIGYQLCCRLLEEEVNVYGMDHCPSEDSLNEEKMMLIGRNAHFQFIDIKDIQRLEQQNLTGIDVVIFSLFDPNEVISKENYHQTKTDVRAAFEKIVSYCEEKKVKLVLLSSSQLEQYEKIEEKEALLNLDLLLSLETCVQTHDKTELEFMILRTPPAYGPWQPTHMDFHRALNATVENDSFKLTKFNLFEENLVYIDDVITAILSVITDADTCKTYQLISAVENQWLDGMKMILNSSDIPNKIPSSNQNFHSNSSTYIIFSPKVSLQEGIANQKNHIKWIKSRLK